MNKLLNIFTAFFGFLLLTGGVLKSFNMFQSLEFSIAGLSLQIPNFTSTTYILLVNLLGGGSMLYHSVATFNFKKPKTINETDIIDNIDIDSIKSEKQTLSIFNQITALIIILVSLWLFIWTLIILHSFGSNILTYLPLFIMVLILYGIFSSIPILLAAKNLNLNNEINQEIEKKKLMKIVSKRQSEG
jgi:hypothetical protein